MTNKIDQLPPLRDIINDHGLRAEKSLGQNFLLDLNLTDKIARHALAGLDDVALNNLTIIEIGPGPGGLTRALLKQPVKKVIAVEYDERAIAALQSLQSAAEGRLELLHQDALKTDLTALCDGPRAIIANLPYNIATPLLTGWLSQIHDNADNFSLMALMFQKEVGDRIAAMPSTKAYGRLSVLSQWLCETRKLIDLPPSAFTPPPKINSSVIYFKPRHLTPQTKPDFNAVEKLTAAAFGQRRKMIRQSLKNYKPQIDKSGLDETLRAENLTITDFLNILNAK